MIQIYGTDDCMWCKKAVELSKNHGLQYEYIDVLASPEAKSEFIRKFPLPNVPKIVWNGQVFDTYNLFAEEMQNTRNYGDGPI